MKRNFGLMGIVLSIVLLVSCNNGIKEYGSVNLDTSAIARHIVQVNADYTSQQEGQPFGNESDFNFTEEETQKLAQLLMTEVYLDVQLKTTGSFEKTEPKKITYLQMMQMSSGSTDAYGNRYSDDLQLEIKNIPVGSTIYLAASVAMVCTDKYKDGVKAIYEAALKRSFGTDDKGNLPEYAQYILDMAIQSLVMGVGGNQKYEGKTDQPITIKAGKNSATIQMYQTDGFMAGGSFVLEVVEEGELELLFENRLVDDEMFISSGDPLYEIIRVEFIADSPGTNVIIDIDEKTVDILDHQENVGMNSTYIISLDGDGLLISLTDPSNDDENVQNIFYEGKFFILAKNSFTGAYKTAVFSGL